MENLADSISGLLGALEVETPWGTLAHLISLLVLTASLAGLAWLAYRHPAEFVKRLCPGLVLLLLTVLASGMIWNAAVTVTEKTLLSLIPDAQWAHAEAMLAGVRVPYEWLVVVFGGGAAYFMLIHRLLHRFAAEFDPADLGRRTRGSAAARRSHAPHGAPSSMS